MDSWVQRIQTAIYTIKRNLESESHHALELQITRPQVFMLHVISKQGKCKLTQLADKLEVKPSAITVMIDRLERAGYVKRFHDTVDRRSVLVEVTPNGQEILEKAISDRVQVFKQYLTRLDEEEIKTLALLLEKLVGESQP